MTDKTSEQIKSEVDAFLKSGGKIETVESVSLTVEDVKKDYDVTLSKIKPFNNHPNPKKFQSRGGAKGGRIAAEMRENGEYRAR